MNATSSIIIATQAPIAGGSEIRAQEAHAGAIEITITPRSRYNNQRMQTEFETVSVLIPKNKRAELAHFLMGQLA